MPRRTLALGRRVGSGSPPWPTVAAKKRSVLAAHLAPDSRPMGRGLKCKMSKILLNLYSITNDNVTLVDGQLDLFYTTYYHVVVLCIVKELIGTGRTLDMWSMI